MTLSLDQEITAECKSIRDRVSRFTDEQKDTLLVLEKIVRRTMVEAKVKKAVELLLRRLGYKSKFVFLADEAISGPFLLQSNKVRVPLVTLKDIAGRTHLGYVEVEKLNGDMREEDVDFLGEFASRAALIFDHTFMYLSLKRTMNSLMEISSFVSHELRGPVAVSLGFEEELQNTIQRLKQLHDRMCLLPDADRNICNEMGRLTSLAVEASIRSHRSARKMLRAIALLDAAEIDRERVRRDRQEVVMSKFLEALTDFIVHDLNERGLVFELFVAPEVKDLKLRVDLSFFERIFDNTLGNAIKYAVPQTAILARIFIKDSRLRFELLNRIYKRIPFKDLNRLFQKGYRKAGSFSRARIGANQGLGLYFINRIVRSGYRGSLQVECGDESRLTGSWNEGQYEKLIFGQTDKELRTGLSCFKMTVAIPLSEIVESPVSHERTRKSTKNTKTS